MDYLQDTKGARITKPVVPKITTSAPSKGSAAVSPEKKRDTNLNPNRRSSVPSVIISPPPLDVKMLKRQSSANAIIKSNMKAKMEKEKQAKNSASNISKGSAKPSNSKFRNVTSKIDTNLSNISKNVKNALKSVATPEKNSSTKRRGSLPVAKPPALQTPSIRRRSLPGSSPATPKRGNMKPSSNRTAGSLDTGRKEVPTTEKPKNTTGRKKGATTIKTAYTGSTMLPTPTKTKMSAIKLAEKLVPEKDNQMHREKNGSAETRVSGTGISQDPNQNTSKRNISSEAELKIQNSERNKNSIMTNKISSSTKDQCSSQTLVKEDTDAGYKQNSEVTKTHSSTIPEKDIAGTIEIQMPEKISFSGKQEPSSAHPVKSSSHVTEKQDLYDNEQQILNSKQEFTSNVPEKLNFSAPEKLPPSTSPTNTSHIPEIHISNIPETQSTINPAIQTPDLLENHNANLSNNHISNVSSNSKDLIGDAIKRQRPNVAVNTASQILEERITNCQEKCGPDVLDEQNSGCAREEGYSDAQDTKSIGIPKNVTDSQPTDLSDKTENTSRSLEYDHVPCTKEYPSHSPNDDIKAPSDTLKSEESPSSIALLATDAYDEGIPEDIIDRTNLGALRRSVEQRGGLDKLAGSDCSGDIEHLMKQLNEDLIEDDRQSEGHTRTRDVEPVNESSRNQEKSKPSLEGENHINFDLSNEMSFNDSSILASDTTDSELFDGDSNKHRRQQQKELDLSQPQAEENDYAENYSPKDARFVPTEHIIDDDDMESVMVPDFTMNGSDIDRNYTDDTHEEITWQDPIHNSALNILDGDEDQVATYLETITEVSNECSDTSQGLTTSRDTTTFNTSRDMSSIFLDDTLNEDEVIILNWCESNAF